MEERIKEDETQRRVIELDKGYHLVLAPAGCGKTHILAERVKRALELGVAPREMLCLTFTNRASRGMRERVGTAIETDISDLFIGNIHRFCSKFLFDNNIVGPTTTILDEDDTLSVINSVSDYIEAGEESPEVVKLDFVQQKRLTAVLQIQHLMMQYRLGHPKSVFLTREADYADDDKTERFFSPERFAEACRAAGLPVDLTSILKIYDDSMNEDSLYPLPPRFEELRELMAAARKYEEYKKRENTIDFDDLLILTYDHATKHNSEIPKYGWIQVDEVQDLSPLQFAIVDAFTAPDHVTVWLGDEQQAIFSFIGAKLNTLETLKARTPENIHHLTKCYRSPKYLLDVFNTYAEGELDTDPALLPKTDRDEALSQEDLVVYYSQDSEKAYKDAVRIAGSYEDGRTAILVSRNADAEMISARMGKTPHIKLSGTDLFSTPQVKLLLTHLNLVNEDTNYQMWAKMLSYLKIIPRHARSQEFISRLKSLAIVPSDFIFYKDSTYLLEFSKAFREKEVVVFDTETTGLNVFEDDIVQIAATRYSNGKATGTLNIFLKTDRTIPEKLGDLDNPLVEEYKRHELHERAEGLKKFLEFAKGCVLVGHNVGYDYNILENNCRRTLPGVELGKEFPEVFDTLKLARLLCPRFRSYKLKDLLVSLNLEGENSHLADADIEATYSLAKYCLKRGEDMEKAVREELKQSEEIAEKLRGVYGPLYLQTVRTLYRRGRKRDTAIVRELRYAYSYFRRKKLISKLPKLKYICRFLRHEVVDKSATPSLYEQLGKHLMELNTFREADLCSGNVIDEKFIIATVHKAKGLEFENVIVFGCVDDIYPFFSSKNDLYARKEDARKLYVAMTRARKRLCLHAFRERVAYSKKWRKNYNFPATLSPFLRRVVATHRFHTVNG